MTIFQKILLFYLRRYPQRLRLTQFNFLAKYAWMQTILFDLKPLLFPQEKAEDSEKQARIIEPPTEDVLQILEATIGGRKGNYQVESWLSRRGHGYLFRASRLGADQQVIVKEYLLNPRLFNELELRQRQQTFENLAGLTLADGRLQDLRIVMPIEAIADSRASHRCYLISQELDGSPTLADKLFDLGAFAPVVVHEILLQTLQSLSLLHHQKFAVQSGQVQQGMHHGNLSLDSLLWVENKDKFYIYLTDLALWENIFLLSTTQVPSNLTRTSQQEQKTLKRQQDLKALGQVAFDLLRGEKTHALLAQDEESWHPGVDPQLKAVIVKLLGIDTPFASALEARQALLRIVPEDIVAYSAGAIAEEEPPEKKINWLPFLASGLGLSLFLIGLFIYSKQATSDEESAAFFPACCLREIDAVPAGEFTYASVKGGSWGYVLSHEDLERPGWSLQKHLESAYPELKLTHQTSLSVETVITLVKMGMVDFGVVPGIYPLPPNLDSQIIGYDGLAVFVAFNYAKRSQGLTASLDGTLSVSAIEQLYRGKIDEWQKLGGTKLPVQLYAPDLPEARQVFEHFVLKHITFNDLAQAEDVDIITEQPFEMFRSVIRDFEQTGGSKQVGGVGFAPLSWVFGQCSVYPLAIQRDGNDLNDLNGVQPLMLDSGQAIKPSTDLCDQKGLYQPNVELFRTNAYPLAYPLMVIFPRDNSLPPAGRKFAEALITVEGQRLLQDAGLVPLSDVEP